MSDAFPETETTCTQTINTGFGSRRFSRFGTGLGVGIGAARPQSSNFEVQAITTVLDEAAERGDARACNAR